MVGVGGIKVACGVAEGEGVLTRVAGWVGVGAGIVEVGITLIVTWAVRVRVPHVAVSIYVAVPAGETATLPGVATPPIPLSMLADSALLTNPQVSVADCPAVMVVGEALKNSMFGVPEQVAGVEAGTTRMLAFNVSPNKTPAGFLNRHTLLKLPRVAGAVIGTIRSAVVPVAVAGTGTGVAAMTCPLKRTNW